MFRFPRLMLLRLSGHQSAREGWWVIAFASRVPPSSLSRLSLSWPTQFHRICFFLCSPLSWGQGMSKHCRVFICWLGSGLLTPLSPSSPFSSAFIAECCVGGTIPLAVSGQPSCRVLSQLRAQPCSACVAQWQQNTGLPPTRHFSRTPQTQHCMGCWEEN